MFPSSAICRRLLGLGVGGGIVSGGTLVGSGSCAAAEIGTADAASSFLGRIEGGSGLLSSCIIAEGGSGLLSSCVISGCALVGSGARAAAQAGTAKDKSLKPLLLIKLLESTPLIPLESMPLLGRIDRGGGLSLGKLNISGGTLVRSGVFTAAEVGTAEDKSLMTLLLIKPLELMPLILLESIPLLERIEGGGGLSSFILQSQLFNS